MKNIIITELKKRMQVWVAALLLLSALVFPQIAGADHTTDQRHAQANTPSSTSSNEAYAVLVTKYNTGEVEFHAPGSRVGGSSGILPVEAHAALVEKFKTGELVFHAPGRRDDSSFTLLANPELRIFQSYVVASPQVLAADADTARWVAQGAAYIAKSDATLLAMNPELGILRSYAVASTQGSSADADSARWAAQGAVFIAESDATLLAMNPELRILRNYADASTQESAVDAETARWVAQGAAFIAENYAASLAENPELRVFRAFAANGVCDLTAQVC